MTCLMLLGLVIVVFSIWTAYDISVRKGLWSHLILMDREVKRLRATIRRLKREKGGEEDGRINS